MRVSLGGLRAVAAVVVLAALAALFAACDGDDGEDRPGTVEVVGSGSASVSVSGASGSASGSVSGTTGSASGSATGSVSGATGSASGSATGSVSGTTGSGTASASGVSAPSSDVSEAMGAYQPVSDVASHALVVLDVCEINGLLPKDAPIDYAAIERVYVEGVNSVKSDGSVRTIAGFARSERGEAIWNDYTAHYGDQTWLDGFVWSAIKGTGAFAGESDLVRRQGIQKGIQNQIMVAWALHEVVAAMNKAADGNFDPASGAPHNWDEGWAFYHGADPGCGPFATADKRGGNFGTGTAVNDALATAFTEGVEALVAGDANAAQAAADEIVRQITITYVQATIRYAHVFDGDLDGGDDGAARVHQAEGWAFFRVLEPLVAGVDADAAATIASYHDLAAGAPKAGAGEAVQSALESVYGGLGISAGEIGTLQ